MEIASTDETRDFSRFQQSGENFPQKREGISLASEEKLSALADHKLFWFLKDMGNRNFPAGVVEEFFYKDGLSDLQHVNANRSLQWGEKRVLKFSFATLGVDSENRLNEDAILIQPLGKDRFVMAVFDGATSQKPIAGLEKFGVTGAFYVSHIASLGFPNSKEFDDLAKREEVSAKDFMIELNSWLYQQLSKVEGIDYQDVLTIPGMAATIAIVDFNTQKISIGNVADTIAIAGYYTSSEILTTNQNEIFDYETLGLAKQIANKERKTIKEIAADPRIKEQLGGSFRKKINTPRGCGILNGMPELVTNNLITEKTIEISNALEQLVLASDGAYSPFLNSEFVDNSGERQRRLNAFLRAFQVKRGVPVPIEAAYWLTLVDSNYGIVPRLKSVDDATSITMKFNPIKVSRNRNNL